MELKTLLIQQASEFYLCLPGQTDAAFHVNIIPVGALVTY